MGKVISLPRSASYRIEEQKYRFKYETAHLASERPLSLSETMEIIREAKRVYALLKGVDGRCDKDVLLLLFNYLKALHTRAMVNCGVQEEAIKSLRVVR